MDGPQILIALGIALVVVAFIVWPMLERRHGTGAPQRVDLDHVERRILEYRAALRRRTLCERCLYANPPASRFCGQCGARLAAADVPTQPAALNPS